MKKIILLPIVALMLEDIINFTMEQITILALYLRKISILYWICI